MGYGEGDQVSPILARKMGLGVLCEAQEAMQGTLGIKLLNLCFSPIDRKIWIFSLT